MLHGCAYCDRIGTTTWDSTTYGEHSYADVWSSDESGSGKPATGSTPETGDNRNMFLWIALLSVSGFGVVTIIVYVYVKKRKSVK